MKRPAPRVRTVAAFTLIELLVVVAIIALLIAILLPSLGRAREKAKIVVCGTHMRQIATALLMYADQNNGTLIIGDVITANSAYPNGFFWSTELVRQGLISNNNNANGNGSGTAVPRGVFYCPDGQLIDGGNGGTFPRDTKNYGYHQQDTGGGAGGALLPGDISVYTWYELPMGNLAVGNQLGNTTGTATPFIYWNMATTAADGSLITNTANYRRSIQMIRSPNTMVCVLEGVSNNMFDDPSGSIGKFPRLSGKHGDATNNGHDGTTNFAFFDGHVASFPTLPYSNNGCNTYVGGAAMPTVAETLFYLQQQL
jgi:prepilin-type processing-associated H-X9-DG protein/prepilin-type N-terminal cleavage/methylation domain-containing protein